MKEKRLPTEMWTIVPVQEYETLIRRCARCDCNSEFVSSRKFRVNANGKQIDVWLIYNCKACNKSWNLPILERAHITTIDKALLQKYMENDGVLAQSIGLRFVGEVNEFRVHKKVIKPQGGPRVIEIKIAPHIKVRADRVLAAGFGISRARLKKLVLEGAIQPLGRNNGTRFLSRPIETGRLLINTISGTIPQLE